ncbi:hypothetical protein HID58_014202, partial [Brassica napus]
TLLNPSPKGKVLVQRLQLISNRSRRESKLPPPSPLMTRNRRYKVDQREDCGGDNSAMDGIEKLKLRCFLGRKLPEQTSVSSITPGTINDCQKLKVSDVSLDKFDDQYFGKVAEKKTSKGKGESDGAVDYKPEHKSYARELILNIMVTLPLDIIT